MGLIKERGRTPQGLAPMSKGRLMTLRFWQVWDIKRTVMVGCSQVWEGGVDRGRRFGFDTGDLKVRIKWLVLIGRPCQCV